MRRTRQALFLVAALLCVGLVFALGSCTDDEDYTGDNVIVSFDSNGGSSVADVEVRKGENIPRPDDPTRDGYVFCGWFSGENYEEQWMFTGFTVTKNITLRAKWTPDVYKINYALDGGTNARSNPTSYTTETNTITLAEPTRAGYAFAGWYDNAEFNGDAVTEIPIGSIGNKQFYAKWTIELYSINYELDGGTNAETNPTSYTTETNTITLAEPTRAGYAFAGWYDNAEFSGKAITKISRGSHENKTFFAKWEAIYTTSGNTITGLTNYAKENITKLLIPTEIDGVRIDSIGDDAFSDCWYLTSITIPDSVTHIEDCSFSDCISLMSINVGENNKHYKSIDGNLYSKDGKTFIQCAIGKIGSSFTIPDGVTSIGDYAFYGCNGREIIDGHVLYFIDGGLKRVTIPNSVTSIGDYAFSGCGRLEYNMYDNAYYLGNEDNPYLFLVEAIDTSIVSCNINEKTKVIGAGAFLRCISLTSINVDENNKNYKSIDGNLYSKDGKTLIQYAVGKKDSSFTIPDSVKSIGDYAFSVCSSLTSIIIPDSVTSIGDYAFSGCISLTSITIPDSVTSIGEWAFCWCSSLTSIIIPDSVTSIGESAFSGCSSLTSITIPNSITSIGDAAFYNCNSLTSIIIPNGVTSIGYGAFWYCISLTSITIPSSVTNIGECSFHFCNSLTNVTFEITTGWNADGASISSTALADPETAAKYLVYTYRYCSWQRNG